MPAGGRGVRVDFDESALAELLTSANGPVARDLEHKAELVTQEAKRLAPTSPHGSNGRRSGYLRSQIGWDITTDSEGLVARVASPAETPDGKPYGLFQEVGTVHMEAQPHLRPALDVIRHT